MQILQKKFPEANSIELTAGQILFEEGDHSREMYVVQEGELQIIKKIGNTTVEIARAGRGDFVGEMSLLESLPRSATAIATLNTKLLVIEPGGFLVKIRRDPTFAYEMLQTLSRRIRLTNERFLELAKNNGLQAQKVQGLIDKTQFEVIS